MTPESQNHSMQPTGASRLALPSIVARSRLAPATDAGRCVRED